MSAALSLHLALHLVPYLDPTEIARARRVCKAWRSIFTSRSLSQAALRVHFPLCREIQCPSASQPLDYSIFNRVSKRYAALKSGIPQQELWIPIKVSHHETIVWTFSENLLVLQSSDYPRAVLTLIYLGARTESRRIIIGELVLDNDGGPVAKVMVCRNMLVVERTSWPENSLGWFWGVDCFRVSLSPGNSKVIATKVSSFSTFGLDRTDRLVWRTSDHSGKYYAAYSSDCTPSELRIWDIETGEMVRRIPDTEFPTICNVTNVLVIARKGPDGPQQVVVAGNDRSDWKEARHPYWDQTTLEWDYMVNFKVFPIEAGSPEWSRSIAHKEQRGRPWRLAGVTPPLARVFKVPRCPVGINSPDTPDTPGYLGEEIGLTLWNWNSDARGFYSSYHIIIPDHAPASAPDAPLAIEREFRNTFRGTPCYSPFSVGFRSGVSLTMDFTSERELYEGGRLMPYQLRVRCFYPSSTPGVMGLDWENTLKYSKSRRKTREVLTVNKDGWGYDDFPLMVVDESELATAFLDLSLGKANLVLLVWGEGLHGQLPLGGKVLN